MSDYSSDEEIDESLTNIDVMNRYTAAATVANKAVAKVVSELKAGATILSLCTSGDNTILEESKKVLKAQKNIERGIAFPTCISRNNVIGHYAAEAGDKEILEDGDLVKVDLGVQIDGFIALVAHSHIVGSSATPTTGKKADVICAAHVAVEAALRHLKPGSKNEDITQVIKQVADAYHVQPVEGVLSHVMKRYVIDGDKVIMNKSTPEQRAEVYEIEANDVYAIDVVMSSGEGKPKEREQKPSVFKRSVDQSYMLKLQASRKVFTEIKQKHPALPFTVRSLEEKHARFGLNELEKNGLVSSYPILYERNGEFVAQIKCTVLVGTAGAKRITEHQLPYVQSEYNVEESIQQLLGKPLVFNKPAASTAPKKKKAKKVQAAAESDASSSTPATTTTTTTTTTSSEVAPMETN